MQTGDHPRRCGENQWLPYIKIPFSGSPPQVRGKRFARADRTLQQGITPAGAGKTVEQRIRRCHTQDHPRGCGENTYFTASFVPSSKSPPRMRGKHPPRSRRRRQAGSPPRMRGKRSTGQLLCPRIGITPADAGKTVDVCLPIAGERDHPRGCGENLQVGHSLSLHKGSPPRMRGKRGGCMMQVCNKGITPADAGKTAAFCLVLLYHQDHPRGCGENTVWQ